jgi:hypothetical protein
VPINVNTTRRERFMEPPALKKDLGGFRHAGPREASESGSFHGIVQREGFSRRRKNAT